LRAKQEIDAASDRVAIFALQMRMARAEERKQRKGGNPRIGISPCPATVLAKHHLLLSCAELIGAPSAIARLGGDEPVERGDNRRLCFCVAALAFDKAKPIGRIAKRKRLGNVGR
jgi:hypothetical protein